MVRSVVLDQFYPDLSDPKYISNFAIYHRRFITNTMPRWSLAQPSRSLGHNGEINTLLTNINWMKAREGVLDQSVTFVEGADLSRIDPLSNPKMSDSSNLDEAITLAVRAGKTPMEALMMLVPEAYKNQPELLNMPEVTSFYDFHSALQDLNMAVRAGKTPSEALKMFVPKGYKNQPELLNMPEVTAFYDYYSALQESWDNPALLVWSDDTAFYDYYSVLQESWDGPALLVWSDGRKIGASLDRNGLRPARFLTTTDGLVCMMSETGVVPGLDEAKIDQEGRLGPGQMIALDLQTGQFSLIRDVKSKKRLTLYAK